MGMVALLCDGGGWWCTVMVRGEGKVYCVGVWVGEGGGDWMGKGGVECT